MSKSVLSKDASIKLFPAHLNDFLTKTTPFPDQKILIPSRKLGCLAKTKFGGDGWGLKGSCILCNVSKLVLWVGVRGCNSVWINHYKAGVRCVDFNALGFILVQKFYTHLGLELLGVSELRSEQGRCSCIHRRARLGADREDAWSLGH